MKTAMDYLSRGKQRTANKCFAALISFYLFEAKFCNSAASFEKGLLVFKIRAKLDVWLKQCCIKLC